MDGRGPRVCLERRVDLSARRLRLRDWPGQGGPLVHVPDPVGPDSASLIDWLGSTLPPRYRVLSLDPRGNSPYQVDAADLLAMLDQFGFVTPVLVGERLGSLAALLVAAWCPARIAGLVLVEATVEPPRGDAIAQRAVRDCPPDWSALRGAVQCPVLWLESAVSLSPCVEDFLTSIKSIQNSKSGG